MTQELGTTAGQSTSAWQNFTSLQSVSNNFSPNLDTPNYTVVSAGGATIARTDYVHDALYRLVCVSRRMNPNAFASGGGCGLSTQGSYGPDQISYYTYDLNGRVTQQIDGYGTSAQSATMTNAYNPNGTLQSMIDANNNKTSYTYDGFDHLMQTQYPAGSGASAAVTYQSLSYYTGTDLLQTATMRDASTVSLSYDHLGRVSTRTSSLGSTDTLGYNLQGATTSIASSATGQTITYAYDAFGRLTQDTQPNGAVGYGYNLASNYSSITWPDGYVAKYFGDLAGNVTSVTMQGATIATYSYDSLGRRTGVAFGNGTSRTYAYDAVSRLAGLQLSFPNAPANNQLIGAVNGTGTAIGYSPASQITSLTRQNTAYSWANSYNVNRTYTPNTLNQLTMSGSVGLGYDLKGDLTASGTTNYGYDWLNRMTSESGSGNAVSLSYDPVSRLVGYTTTATTNLIYAGSSLIAETSSGTVLNRYVPGPGTDEPIVWYQGATLSNPRYLQADERGSIVAVSDGGGSNVVINTYDEFGIPGPNNAGRFGYTGQTWFSEIGLYNYKARFYSPTLGRFMQTDPIGYGDGLNMYNYAHGDPVNGSDPFGLADPIDFTPDGIENAVSAITGSQAGSGYDGTLYATFGGQFSGSGSFVSNGWDPNSSTGFVNYNNYGQPGALPTLYGSYQATVTQPQSGGCGSHPILGAIGKVWNSPNTLLGLAAAGASYAAGKFAVPGTQRGSGVPNGVPGTQYQ